MPTTPASGAPLPDVVVGLLNCNAAHMPDVSGHPGGPSLLRVQAAEAARWLVVRGRSPGFKKRNAIFTPTLMDSGCGPPLVAEAKPRARGEREKERERERERGCRRHWEGEQRRGMGNDFMQGCAPA